MNGIASVRALRHSYGKTLALQGLDIEFPAGKMLGVIGPDGVGKSTLLALLAGARQLQQGEVQVLGASMRSSKHRRQVCPRIAYMPQGLGKNLYPSLSVAENLQFFAQLFGHSDAEAKRRIQYLTQATGLLPFLDRPAGKLSGGMKQKLSLCCALIHDPDLLILDEPTTGVDPLARSQFWTLIAGIRAQRPAMSVIVATAYMDEAAQFDWLLMLNAGAVLAADTPQAIFQQTGCQDLEQAFVRLLPEAPVQTSMPDLPALASDEIAIEASGLTMQFGDFTAVDQVSFQIRRGEIFGFLGSNGCGKSTTMKMLTGLLPASSGTASLFGQPVSADDLTTRRRVGYMSQAFSLYTELTVRQNLELHARLFAVPAAEIQSRVTEMVGRFGLSQVLDELPEKLPLGMRQRLSLAVAMVHKPDLLILDEPTSGVDPVARDQFWQLMLELARRDQVTIFISTHFMSEAMRCDRISLMHAGKVLVSAAPEQIAASHPSGQLEQAFIQQLRDAGADQQQAQSQLELPQSQARSASAARFSLKRLWALARRESMELSRDPLRAVMALFGSLLLMVVMGYGITMDVDNLKFAVLDQDQSLKSQNYLLQLSGSRYFSEQAPLSSMAELDQRMQAGEIALAVQIPPGFGRDLEAGKTVALSAWVDGAMPKRAETIQAYVQGMHSYWLQSQAEKVGVNLGSLVLETRYRYNPDVKSLVAMVPGVIPMLLLMIPAVLTALSVVREKELGSIINLYVTPTLRSEFLLGKQLPYIGIAFISFILMLLMATLVFGVPFTGDLLFYLLAGLVFVSFATGFGLFASIFTRSQVSAIVVAVLGTMVPAVQFSGMIDPVSSLEGAGRLIGEAYPASHFLTISRGVFSKALHYSDLHLAFYSMLLSVPVILVLSVLLLNKQER